MLNVIVLIGRTTKDMELRYTNINNVAVSNATIAVNRMKKQGAEQETDFIPFITFGKTAENCVKYIGKGSLIAIEGRLQVRTFDDRDGNRQWRTEVVAIKVEFLALKEPGGKASTYQQEQIEISDEDVPY